MAFRGWPAEAFDFYAELEADNSKVWWHAHRSVYDRAVKAQFEELSGAVAKRYGPLHLFRPHRDTRFSRDKSPYKTAAGAVTEGDHGAAYYVQISAEGLFVGTGMYMLAVDQLERFRAAIDDGRTGTQLARLVGGLRAERYEIGAMQSLKTTPRGYAKDHPRVELLRLKGLTMGRSWTVAQWMHTARALDRITTVWDDAAAMNRWLARHVGPSTVAPPEPR